MARAVLVTYYPINKPLSIQTNNQRSCTIHRSALRGRISRLTQVRIADCCCFLLGPGLSITRHLKKVLIIFDQVLIRLNKTYNINMHFSSYLFIYMTFIMFRNTTFVTSNDLGYPNILSNRPIAYREVKYIFWSIFHIVSTKVQTWDKPSMQTTDSHFLFCNIDSIQSLLFPFYIGDCVTIIVNYTNAHLKLHVS